LWIILIKGLTPIPYQLVTIASGMAHFSLAVFILASILTGGLRFFMVAGLLCWHGAPIRDFIEARLTLVATGFAALSRAAWVDLRGAELAFGRPGPAFSRLVLGLVSA
jgi:hypothetical protein